MTVFRIYGRSPGRSSLSFYLGRFGFSFGIQADPRKRRRGKYGISWRAFDRIGVLLVVRQANVR